MAAGHSDVTLLLREYAGGDRGGLDRLIPLLHAELRRIAVGCLRGRAGAQMQPESLINEAYISLAGAGAADISGRKHFFALAARIMRQILVDNARARLSAKRGGDAALVTFNEALFAAPARPSQVLDLDSALSELQRFDERKARLLELRYFAGLSLEEVAEELEVSRATAVRDLRFARSWLLRHMGTASPAAE